MIEQTLPITSGNPQPCPMPGCGGIAEMAFYASRNDFWVRCMKDFGHRGPHKLSEAEALAAWNESPLRVLLKDTELLLKLAREERDEYRDKYSDLAEVIWQQQMGTAGAEMIGGTPEERLIGLVDYLSNEPLELSTKIVNQMTEIAGLRTRLEAAEKDTERLDWLEQKAAERGNTCVQVEADGNIDWWINPDNAIKPEGVFASTLRAGIDAAKLQAPA